MTLTCAWTIMRLWLPAMQHEVQAAVTRRAFGFGVQRKWYCIVCALPLPLLLLLASKGISEHSTQPKPDYAELFLSNCKQNCEQPYEAWRACEETLSLTFCFLYHEKFRTDVLTDPNRNRLRAAWDGEMQRKMVSRWKLGVSEYTRVQILKRIDMSGLMVWLFTHWLPHVMKKRLKQLSLHLRYRKLLYRLTFELDNNYLITWTLNRLQNSYFLVRFYI